MTFSSANYTYLLKQLFAKRNTDESIGLFYVARFLPVTGNVLENLAKQPPTSLVKKANENMFDFINLIATYIFTLF